MTRGFIGCHGARTNSEGEIYFSDSCTGSLVVLDEESRIKRRFRVDSLWMHDSLQIRDNIYAFSISDKNELHFYDIHRMKLLH